MAMLKIGPFVMFSGLLSQSEKNREINAVNANFPNKYIILK